MTKIFVSLSDISCSPVYKDDIVRIVIFNKMIEVVVTGPDFQGVEVEISGVYPIDDEFTITPGSKKVSHIFIPLNVLIVKGQVLLSCSVLSRNAGVRMNERYRIAFYEHMNNMMQLCGDLTEKTAFTNLGPADGQLYMQLCSTITAYARGVEETFDGRDDDSNESPSDDTGSAGDKSPSSD